jgi:hypothetical protein
MKTIALTPQERLLGFTHKLILKAADLLDKTSGTAFAIFPGLASAVTFPAGTQIRKCAAQLITACDKSAGTLTGLTMDLGDGGDPNRALDAFDLLAGTFLNQPTTIPYTYTAADTFDATVTKTGTATMAQLTSLEVHIYLDVVYIPDLNKPI